MTCITEKLEDVPCLFCKKADQVYIGHGDVRFCAHCTMSWDLREDHTVAKSVIFSDSATDGELPEDIVSRMGILSGKILSLLDFEGRLQRVLALPEDIFLKHNLPGDRPKSYGDIETGSSKATPWQEIVSADDFTPVMILIHETIRMNEVDIKVLATQLFEARKTEFDDSVSDYLGQMGKGGSGDLTDKKHLAKIRLQSELDASRIAATYNSDLAVSIKNIKNSTPRANRYTYASGLRAWEAERRTWKITQIALNTIMTARDDALKTFSEKNDLAPDVELFPRKAAEPICTGWINRGVLPYDIAKSNNSPFHVGCLHFWRPIFSPTDKDLWTG